MPHLTIEYCRKLEEQKSAAELLAAVHQGAMNSELFPPAVVKIRCAAFDDTSVGGSADGTFLHVRARILSGRTPEQKTKLSHEIYVQLLALNLTVDALTVEICDIDRVSHQPCPD